MIPRYTHPEMGRIWSEERRFETWLQVEIAAAEAMAEAGIIPHDAARDIKEKSTVRRRPHRRNRGNHPTRRHRFHDGRGRARRAVGALAAFRSDVVRRRRHRAGHSDARGDRPPHEGCREAARCRPRARRRASPHADDGAHAWRACRADDVRVEAGAVVRGAAARPRTR